MYAHFTPFHIQILCAGMYEKGALIYAQRLLIARKLHIYIYFFFFFGSLLLYPRVHTHDHKGWEGKLATSLNE